MPKDSQSPEDLLLDLHLDRLDEKDRAWLHAEFRRDSELRAKSDRLGSVLRPLDHWAVAQTPPNLADKVLLAIERSTFDLPQAVIPITENERCPPAPFISIRQVALIAACIAALVSVAVPGLSEVRALSNRTACANNLGSIFRGTRMYQQAFGGSLPFAGNIAGAAWLPNAGRDRPYQSNSRHIFLIAKHNFGPQLKEFVCPSCGSGKPMRADELANYDDFAGARNISYDSLNMAGDRPNLRPRIAMAYLGDSNPLFVNARFDSSVDPTRTNSPAHRGRCQRVLILDGSVIRLTVPVYGPQKDNLWLAGKIRRYVGTETPSSNDDAFLIPGYPDTDPIITRHTAN